MLKILGTKVLVAGNRNKGVVKIYYFSLDDLNRIYDRIKGVSS
jgi:ParB family chromosome partitioning protein